MLIANTDYVGQHGKDVRDLLFVCLSCLFVCLSVCPQHNSNTNDPKVFKLDIGNGFGISYK